MAGCSTAVRAMRKCSRREGPKPTEPASHTRQRWRGAQRARHSPARERPSVRSSPYPPCSWPREASLLRSSRQGRARTPQCSATRRPPPVFSARNTEESGLLASAYSSTWITRCCRIGRSQPRTSPTSVPTSECAPNVVGLGDAMTLDGESRPNHVSRRLTAAPYDPPRMSPEPRRAERNPPPSAPSPAGGGLRGDFSRRENRTCQPCPLTLCAKAGW